MLSQWGPGCPALAAHLSGPFPRRRRKRIAAGAATRPPGACPKTRDRRWRDSPAYVAQSHDRLRMPELNAGGRFLRTQPIPAGSDRAAVGSTDIETAIKAVHPSSNGTMSFSPPASSAQANPWRPRPTTYRCFLSDLTGFIAARRTGPRHQHRFAAPVLIRTALGREFNPAKADCGYRAPLVPRRARPIPTVRTVLVRGQSSRRTPTEA